VIDASVAGTVGSRQTAQSRNCREFLKSLRDICHRIVITPEIATELRRHSAPFFREWWTSMAARKKIHKVTPPPDATLRRRIEGAATNSRNRQAMLKDLRLIEAALATDHAVVSLDENARRLFSDAAEGIGELRSIAWVNPDKSDEEPIAWLEGGARPEPDRCLGLQD